MRQLVRQQAKRLGCIGSVSGAKRDGSAIGQRVGVLVGCDARRLWPPIDTRTRWINARRFMKRRAR
jgi:hypothetical protein